MERYLELLQKITAPLSFALSDGGKHLPLIKDLGKTMRILAERMAREMPPLSLPAPGRENDLPGKKLIAPFSALFVDFERLPLEQKESQIKKALLLVKELEQALTATSSPPPAAGPGPAPAPGVTSPAGQDEAGICREKLSRPALAVRGVGTKTALLLEKKGLATVEDLLYFLPRRYEDRRHPVTIPGARVGARETITGTVALAETRYYGRRPVFEVTLEDEGGLLKAKWFKGNPTYLRGLFQKGAHVILTGEVSQYLQNKEMVHPDFEILDKESDNLLHFKRIVPIYSETEGLYQKNLRRIMKQVLDDYAASVLSPIPADICRRQELLDIREALQQVHFPGPEQNPDAYNSGQTAAHRRLIFDEFFFFQLAMALKRKGQGLKRGIAFRTGGGASEKFLRSLPFPLTAAQQRVIGEIEGDMARPTPMHRLLQGDVGCGKTVVAMAALATACANGYQAAFMAPTEILAEQHYHTIKKWAADLGIDVLILTGNTNGAEKKDLYGQIGDGRAQIVIGTHALLQEGVSFHKLGLAVIDEQHRFGVLQRAILRGKGAGPDILVMTATPIPRTLAMTVYGDLDVSVIDELPPGHKPVRTKVFYEQQRHKVYEAIRAEINKGHQAFIVYPLVEESASLDMKDATGMAEHLQRDVFPEVKVGLLHGQMKKAEKAEIMAAFGEKRISILVATTVIEVGIDVPCASLMVIEHAERFGLSQLHQLRGRVGRSDIPSACILLTPGAGSQDARKRLRVMEKTQDGFLIAEEDLALRGPGEFMGARQSGLPDFRIANLSRDGKILSEAKSSAFALVEGDPQLEKPEHQLLNEVLRQRWEGRLEMAQTG